MYTLALPAHSSPALPPNSHGKGLPWPLTPPLLSLPCTLHPSLSTSSGPGSTSYNCPCRPIPLPVGKVGPAGHIRRSLMSLGSRPHLAPCRASPNTSSSPVAPKPGPCLRWQDCELRRGGGLPPRPLSLQGLAGLRSLRAAQQSPLRCPSWSLNPQWAQLSPLVPAPLRRVHLQAGSGYPAPEALGRQPGGGRSLSPWGTESEQLGAGQGPPPAPYPLSQSHCQVRRGSSMVEGVVARFTGGRGPAHPRSLHGLSRGHHPAPCSTGPAWWPLESGKSRANPCPFTPFPN